MFYYVKFVFGTKYQIILQSRGYDQGQIQDFKLGGAHLRKSRPAEGGAKILGVFRVKNHDFTTKNHIFSNCGGKRENFWGISCEKSRFNAKKSYFFQFQGGIAPGAPPGSAPGMWIRKWGSSKSQLYPPTNKQVVGIQSVD